MIVFTDNIDYADSIIATSAPWTPHDSPDHNESLRALLLALFGTDVLFISRMDAHPSWTHLFAVEYAPASQFSLLTKVLEKNEGVSGIVCLAGHGDNFKGQRNRTWHSLPGNIHLSAFLKPDRAIRNSHIGFTILSAVSVVQTLDQIAGLKERVSIKWVNDILIDRRKVAGVLTQTQMQGDIVRGVFIGIGINVERSPEPPQDLPGLKPISIRVVVDGDTRSYQPFVLKTLLACLADNYVKICDGQYEAILETYKVRSIMVGKKVAVYSDPMDEAPKRIEEGVVASIGDSLELYLEGKTEPVIRGRIVLL
jgi:biotin-[acetyl-CoA-carboxylase] ligase BirA-like protein